MMQVMEFLTLYAEELFLMVVSMIVILLLVTLHRIRRIAKSLQDIVSYTREIAHEQKTQQTVMQTYKEEVGQAKTEAVPKVKTQEKLLSEVLDEVFP